MWNSRNSRVLLLVALLAGGVPAWGQTNGSTAGSATSENLTLTTGSGTGLCTAGFNPEPRVTQLAYGGPGGLLTVRVNLCGSPPGSVMTWRILDRPGCFAGVDADTPYNAQSRDQFKSTAFVLSDKAATYITIRLRISSKPVCTQAGLPPVGLEAFYGDLRRNLSLAQAPLGPLHLRTRLGPSVQPVL